MNWKTLTLWTDEQTGKVWHSLRGHPNNRDLSMGPVNWYEIEKLISWAKSHTLEIIDNRAAKAAA